MSTVIPVLRYADPATALAFIEAGLGFERRMATENEDGVIVHAELARPDGMLMVSNAEAPTPAEVYLVDPEPDALFERAMAAGATAVYEPMDQPYGSREFAVTDPEGTTWYVGTYRPE